MATKIFNARFQFKGDTLSSWSTANPVLLKNELAIVTVPAEAGAVVQEPAILFKVGDGATAFNDLPFVSSNAADVYDWAKAAAKPTYTADEIDGLADYIAGEIEDSNTEYKLEQSEEDPHVLTLSSKEKGGQWAVIATITTADTVYDDTALAGRVDALETLVGSDTVASQIATAIAALDLANTYATKDDLDAVEAAIPTNVSELENDVGYQTESDVAAAIAAADHLKRKKVDSVDDIDVEAADADQYIYMVPKGGDNNGDKYDEYMVLDGAVERVGDWSVELSGYVQKEDGKGLSTNDYTDADKDKLAAIEDGADVNSIEGIQVNGETVTPDAGKVVDITVPAGALADKDKVAKTDLADDLQDEIDGKAADADLADIAKTGNVNDLVQADGDVVVFNCGSATTVI